MSDEFQAGLPAKYQDVCASLTEELEAECVMLIVVGGIRGEGFSVSARQGYVPDLHNGAGVARYLRSLADRVDRNPGGKGVMLRPALRKGSKS